MYNNKLTMAIKVDDQILREDHDKVFIPFGREYKIFVKNLNTVRAKVEVFVDGVSLFNGNDLILEPNQYVDLERFVTDMNFGNKLKFIERTSSIEKYRGIKSEDGLVSIQYQFEKPSVKYFVPKYEIGSFVDNTYINASSILRASTKTSSEAFYSAEVSYKNDVGITVPGSLSNQKFTEGEHFEVEDTVYTMILQLVGQVETAEKKIVKVTSPIKTSFKPKCPVCGKLNKSVAKYCNECGTSLQLFSSNK